MARRKSKIVKNILDYDQIDLCPWLLTLHTEGSVLYSAFKKQYVPNCDTDTTRIDH